MRINKEFDSSYKASTWETNYGTLFEAIQMERFLVAFMLMTLVLISSYNLMSMLIMTIKEKESQIAILISLGATNNLIRNIFLFFGFLIGLVGILIGLLAGLLLTNYLGTIVGFIENLFGIQFMTVYFINYFPNRHKSTLDCIYMRYFFCLSMYCKCLSGQYCFKVEPAEALKYE